MNVGESCALLSLAIAVGINVLAVTFIYIFSWRNPRHTVEGVKLRLFGMFFASMASTTYLQSMGFVTLHQLTPSIEYSFDMFVETMVIPIAITLTLFIGPIFDRYMEGTLFTAPAQYQIQEKLRSYIFGPIIEEYLYRFLITTLLLKCFSVQHTVLISATLFSISHAHHHYIALLRSGSCDWAHFGIHSLSTFIFGLYSCILYIRIKSVVCLALIHAFCNWMNVPRVNRLMSRFYLCFMTLFGLASSMTLLYFFTDDYSRYRALYVH